MTFNEANTVEQMVLDACVSNGWTYAAGPSLSRQASEVFVESSLRQALIKLNPEVKGIVSSGYSEDPVLSNFKEYGFCAILQKPYDVIDLDETIKRVILVS